MSDSISFPVKIEPLLSSSDFMRSIQDFQVPPEKIAQWTLGQNGFVLKTPAGTIIAIDPYLSDYCAMRHKGERAKRSRILPIFIEPEDFIADLIVLTHSHCDHADPYTLERYRSKDTTIFLAPWQTLPVLKQAGVNDAGIVLMHPLQTWKNHDVEIIGTFAQPTDRHDLNHLGFVFRFSNGLTYWNSGDTAPNELLAHVADFKPDWMTICINGGYHNLSHWDAAAVTAAVKPKVAVPCHFDMMPHNVAHPHMFQYSLSRQAPDVEYRRLEYYRPNLFM